MGLSSQSVRKIDCAGIFSYVPAPQMQYCKSTETNFHICGRVFFQHCRYGDAEDRALRQYLADPFSEGRVKTRKWGWTIMKGMLKCLLMGYENETCRRDL